MKPPEELPLVAGVLPAAEFSLELFCSFCSWRRRTFLSRRKFFRSLWLGSLHWCGWGSELESLGSFWRGSFIRPWPCSFSYGCLLTCKLGQWPWGQYWSTSFICEAGLPRVFSSVAVAFRINTSQFLYSSSELSISAWIDYRRPSWKKRIGSDSPGAPSRSYSCSIDCRCSGWEAQSCAFSTRYRVSPKPISDTFYKGPRIAAIFTKKSLEFFPGYNNIRPFFLGMPKFVLCTASANAISKKRGRKRSAIFSIGSSYIKIVFALLVKPIAIQMWFSIIQVRKPSFERLFLWLYWY